MTNWPLPVIHSSSELLIGSWAQYLASVIICLCVFAKSSKYFWICFLSDTTNHLVWFCTPSGYTLKAGTQWKSLFIYFEELPILYVTSGVFWHWDQIGLPLLTGERPALRTLWYKWWQWFYLKVMMVMSKLKETAIYVFFLDYY